MVQEVRQKRDILDRRSSLLSLRYGYWVPVQPVRGHYCTENEYNLLYHKLVAE